jgi:hypothetical protein
MGKLISAIVGSLLTLIVVCAGPGVAWWDRRPAGVLVFHFLWWQTPDSLKAQRDALKVAFTKEQTAFNAMKGALDRQNAAVASLSTSAQAWQRRSALAVSDATRSNAWRLQTADVIQRETLPADTSDAERCNAAETLLRSAAR